MILIFLLLQVSYVNTNGQVPNITVIQVDNGGDSTLSFTYNDLSQGTYNFIVVASTANGTGEAANVTRSIIGQLIIVAIKLL